MRSSKTFWRWATNETNLPHLRILYEAHFISMQSAAVFKDYLGENTSVWPEVIEDSLPESIRSKAMATLCAAAFDGLIVEHMSSGDPRAKAQSVDLLNEMLAVKAGVKLPPYGD